MRGGDGVCQHVQDESATENPRELVFDLMWGGGEEREVTRVISEIKPITLSPGLVHFRFFEVPQSWLSETIDCCILLIVVQRNFKSKRISELPHTSEIPLEITMSEHT